MKVCTGFIVNIKVLNELCDKCTNEERHFKEITEDGFQCIENAAR